MRIARAAVSAAVAGALASCSFAPAYHPPSIAPPAAFKEAPAGWSAATPMDATPRGAWWSMFGDDRLNTLEKQAAAASPTLAAALARYDEARATAREAGADLFPTISQDSEIDRERLSARRPLGNDRANTSTDHAVGASFDYELDLWGRIRNNVAASKADAAASGADLAAARLDLQAAVADAYFRLRGLDAQSELLRSTAQAYDRAYRLTATRHSGGIASGVDVSRAQSQLSSARAQISAIASQRAAVSHEIAALVGELPSALTLPPQTETLTPPNVPASTPSELLQRRPDIAAAERRVFAANARIGVARAAFFPTLSLGLSGGFEATQGSLLATPSTYWALGPLSSVLTLFDGGRRRARVAISRAQYDEAADDYRQTVLTAFREVEDALAASRLLAQQAVDQRDAMTAAERTRDLAMTRYRDGATDYLEVVIAQTAALDAERQFIALQTDRMRTAIALVRATGGGLSEPPTS